MQDDKQKDTAEKGVTVLVNTREKIVTEKELSFDQIVNLAYDDRPTGQNIEYTVNFRLARGEQEHSLVEGKTVEITKGMIFNVGITDKS